MLQLAFQAGPCNLLCVLFTVGPLRRVALFWMRKCWINWSSWQLAWIKANGLWAMRERAEPFVSREIGMCNSMRFAVAALSNGCQRLNSLCEVMIIIANYLLTALFFAD